MHFNETGVQEIKSPARDPGESKTHLDARGRSARDTIIAEALRRGGSRCGRVGAGRPAGWGRRRNGLNTSHPGDVSWLVFSPFLLLPAREARPTLIHRAPTVLTGARLRLAPRLRASAIVVSRGLRNPTVATRIFFRVQKIKVFLLIS